MANADFSQICIRSATTEDATQLAILRYQFRSELATPMESQAAFVTRAIQWFRTHLGTGNWRAWVAEAGTAQLVGHLFAQFIEKIPNPVVEAEMLVYLTNFYVISSLRGQGIGERILQAALAECEKAEVDSIILWPTEQSIPFYQRYGFAKPAKLMELPWKSYKEMQAG